VWTHVVDAGEGPPVVLLHGYGDTADGWHRVVPALLEDHRVIALDLPPFGRSGTPEGVQLTRFYGDFFPALFEQLEVGPTTLIGHSLGGALALHLAIAAPPLVCRLGLVGSAGLGSAPTWWWHLIAGNKVLWRAALSVPNPVTPLLIREGMRRFLNWRLVEDSRHSSIAVEHLVRLNSASTKDFEALIAAGRDLLPSYSGTLLEDSKVIDCPKWVAWGRNDNLAPVAHARAFAEAHPDAELHLFDRCGHYPQVERWRGFNSKLRKWLEATADQGAERAA
jgi:pimeloyl-ACP methyl ester carboxylesterase